MQTKKIAIVLFMILLLTPIWFMLIGGIQDINGIFKMPPDLFPVRPTLKNYKLIFENLNLVWLSNTAIVVICTAVLSIIVSASAGYSFAFFNFKGKKIIWMIILTGLFIPRITLYIPQYVILRKIGIAGTLAGVILPLIYTPMGMYLSRIYFQTIPVSLLESARLDGANEVQILRKIIIPLSKPIITTLGLFASIAALSDYVWQMLVLQRPNSQTLLVGFMKLITNYASTPGMRVNPIGQSMAIGTLLLLPVLIIFSIASKYFTNSLSGAIKE